MASELKNFSKGVTQILPYMLREFMKREDNDLTKGKISFPQLIALSILADQGRMRMKDLAKALSISMPSTTSLTDRLVQQKMIERYGCPQDRRVVWVNLLAKGSAVLKRFQAEKQRSVESLFSVLTVAERKEYLRILTKVSRAWNV